MHNAYMPLIQIRDVPEAVRDELARKAAAAGQSMQAYLLGELSEQRGCLRAAGHDATQWGVAVDSLTDLSIALRVEQVTALKKEVRPAAATALLCTTVGSFRFLV
jgi:hypothetical protein